MDGNSSLKRVAAIGDRTASDVREFEESDYYLSSRFVDNFAGEVNQRSSGTNPHRSDDTSPLRDLEGSAHDMRNDGNEPEGVGDGCRARDWKAAGEKGTWGIFKESGIFASACRHGFILWIVDMVRSGEL
jgi:hypothetical protein